MKRKMLLALAASSIIFAASCSSTPDDELSASATEETETDKAAAENGANDASKDDAAKNAPVAKPTAKKAAPAPKAATAPTPAPTPKAVATPVPTPAPAMFALPEPGSLEPFFPRPEPPGLPLISKFVGQDTTILEFADLRPQATAPRLKQIAAMMAQAKAASSSKDVKSYVDARTKLHQLLKEHALYLEYLQATGMKDPAIPDVAGNAAKVYSLILQNATVLKKRASGSPIGVIGYDTDILVARLRMADTGVLQQAQAFVANNSTTAFGLRVRLVGAGEDATTNAFQGAFGKPSDVMDLPQSTNSRAALMFLDAISDEARKATGKAIDNYTEALNNLTVLMRPGTAPFPILLVGADRLVQLALVQRPTQVQEPVMEIVRRLGLNNLARYYIEQTALAARKTNPALAIEQYKLIESSGSQTPQEKARINSRLLDFALVGNDRIGIRMYWEILLGLNDTFKLSGLASRANLTIKQLTAKVQTKPSKDAMETLLNTHELFREKLADYRANDAPEFDIINILMKQNAFDAVAKRADKLAAMPDRRADIKRLAIQYSLRAREKILGLKAEPDWKPAAPNSLPKDVVLPYLKSLTDLDAVSTIPSEKENATFQGAYIAFFGPDMQDASKRLEKGITNYPGSKHASRGATFFIEYAQEVKDFATMEKLARLADKSMLIPLGKGSPDYKTLLLTAIIEQGKAAAAAKKTDEALNKFRLCQKDFPNSPKAAECAVQAAAILESQNKFHEALMENEKILRNYPTSPSAEEARWQAAKLAEKVGDSNRAGQLYEAYAIASAKKNPDRKAWLLSAQSFRKAQNLNKATEAYNQHLRTITDKTEKLKVTKELAALYAERQVTATAVSLYEQAIELAKSVPGSKEADEEILILDRIVELLMAAGQNDAASRRAEKIVASTPKTREGMMRVAKAKRIQGQIVADELRQSVENGTSFEILLSQFDRARKLLLAECEIPNSKFCAQTHLEIASAAFRVVQAYAKTTKAEKDAMPEKVKLSLSTLRAQVTIQLEEARTALAQQPDAPKDLSGKIEELANASEKQLN